MTDLPAGFVLEDQPAGPAAPGLPEGFIPDTPGAVQAPVHTGSPSLMTNFLYGAGQPFTQAATMLSKVAPNYTPPSWATANQTSEAAFNRENAFPGAAGKVAELAGNVAATAPIAAVVPGGAGASMLARMGAGAAAGGLSGALTPVDPNAPDFWTSVAKNQLLGSLGGAAAAPAMGAVSRFISPNAASRIEPLMGATPTPGQILGGAANRMEQGATSLPVIGDFIKNARRGAVGDWNDALINNALEPIGQKISPDLTALTDKIGDMQSKWSDHFNELVPKLGVPAADVDPVANSTLHNGLQSILNDAPAMARGDQLKGLIQSRITDRMSPGGGITGETWQDADSYLNKLANNPRNGYIHSSDPDVQQLGEAINGTRKVLMDSLVAADPEAQAGLMAARSSYALIARINDAASRAAKSKSPELISPSQYMGAVASGSTKNQLAAGRALGQPEASAATSILGDTLPDSGTPYRHALQLGSGMGMAALGGHAAASALPIVGSASEYALPALAAYGGLSGLTGAMYSPLGRQLLGGLLTSRPSFAPAVAQGVRGLSPLASVMAGRSTASP